MSLMTTWQMIQENDRKRILFLLHDPEIQCNNYDHNEKSKMITAVSRIAAIASPLFTPMRAYLEPSNMYDWYEYIRIYEHINVNIHEYFKIVRFIKGFLKKICITFKIRICSFWSWYFFCGLIIMQNIDLLDFLDLCIQFHSKILLLND